MKYVFVEWINTVTDNVLRISEVKVWSFVVCAALGRERRPLWRVCH